MHTAAGEIQPLVDQAVSEGFSGVVRVDVRNDPVYVSASGFANRAWRVPNHPETIFRIASISKLFTAVAILQLVDAGRIALSDSIHTLLPDAAAHVSPAVTVEHLLTMTSGIADWFDETGDWQADWAAFLREHPIGHLRTNADYLPLFAGKPALFQSGERHLYNGAGYILLGLLIERLARASYFDHVRDRVLAPAGAARTGFVALDEVVPDVAEGYVHSGSGDDGSDHAGGEGWRRNTYLTTPRGAADGGATSTASDLIAFSRALRSGHLLTEATTRGMLTPRVLEQDEPYRGYTWMYGYGVMFILDSAGTVVRWGHTGEEEGVSCRLYHYPGLDADVVILGNTSNTAGKLAWRIHDWLLADRG